MGFIKNVEFRNEYNNISSNIQFCVNDSTNSERPCKPFIILSDLIRNNQFEMIYKEMTKETPLGEVTGNCHEVAVTIMAELIRQNICKGWEWCKGYKKDGISEGVN